MKKFIIIAITCMASIVVVTARQIQVPLAVGKAFGLRFPSAQNVKWDKESKYEYEAVFLLSGKKVSTNFSASGNWLETEMPISQSAAPKVVMDGFGAKFPGAKVNQVYQISSPGGKEYFEIEYTLKGKKKEAKLSAGGGVI